MASPLRTVSYGGGVQSTALLVLAAQGVIDYRTFLFANVGDDSEHPDSLRYVAEVAAPFAAEHGIELLTLHRQLRDGTPETLMGRLMKPGSRSLPIPVRMSNGAPGHRSCTADFKIRVIAKELKARGASVAEPATVALGISVDEIERAKPGLDPRMPFQFRVYPLLDLGLSRTDCKRIIADGGLPVPGKSACYFCPFHDKAAWADLAHETPHLFRQSVELEAHLNRQRDEMACQGVGEPPASDRTCAKCKRRVDLDEEGLVAFHGKDHVYLTRHGRPLDEVVAADQGRLDLGLDGCDSGYCFT